MADIAAISGEHCESALAGHLVPGQYGKVGVPGITLQEIPRLPVCQLSAWSDSIEQVKQEACRLAGIESGPLDRFATAGSAGWLLHVEPLKWWLLGKAAKGPDIDARLGCVLDLSQSRTCLSVCGEHATTLLNRHLSVDLREKSCPVNRVLSTGFHHVGITLWRSQAGFVLFLPRSFAVSQFTLLCESAEQFGYEIIEHGEIIENGDIVENGRTPPWQPG